MKIVNTWLNEKEFKQLKERAKQLEKTTYAILKKLLKEFLEDKNAGLCLLVWQVCYSLIATCFILVLA